MASGADWFVSSPFIFFSAANCSGLSVCLGAEAS